MSGSDSSRLRVTLWFLATMAAFVLLTTDGYRASLQSAIDAAHL
jgi:hypothetical protein